MFWVFVYIFGVGEGRVLKFCTQVSHIKYYPWDDRAPQMCMVRVK